MNTIEALTWVLDHPTRPGALQGPRTRLGNHIVVQHAVGATIPSTAGDLQDGDVLVGAVGTKIVEHVATLTQAARQIVATRDRYQDDVLAELETSSKWTIGRLASKRTYNDPVWGGSRDFRPWSSYSYTPSEAEDAWVKACSTELFTRVYKAEPYQDETVEGHVALVSLRLLEDAPEVIVKRTPISGVTINERPAAIIVLTSDEVETVKRSWGNLASYQRNYSFPPQIYTGKHDLQGVLDDPDFRGLIEHALSNETGDVDLDTIIDVIARNFV